MYSFFFQIWYFKLVSGIHTRRRQSSWAKRALDGTFLMIQGIQYLNTCRIVLMFQGYLVSYLIKLMGSSIMKIHNCYPSHWTQYEIWYCFPFLLQILISHIWLFISSAIHDYSSWCFHFIIFISSLIFMNNDTCW